MHCSFASMNSHPLKNRLEASMALSSSRRAMEKGTKSNAWSNAMERSIERTETNNVLLRVCTSNGAIVTLKWLSTLDKNGYLENKYWKVLLSTYLRRERLNSESDQKIRWFAGMLRYSAQIPDRQSRLITYANLKCRKIPTHLKPTKFQSALPRPSE